MKIIRGFTLIELIIVVVIIGILAAIIYPSYIEYVNRTKRIEAQAILQNISHKLIAYKVTNATFKDINISALYGTNIPNTGTKNYTLEIKDIDEVSFDKSTKLATWKLIAIPAGTMVGTGKLTLDSTGKQCWEKTTGICASWSDK